EQRCNAIKVPFECKNYTREMATPELDQIAGRLSYNRGWLGFVVGRRFEDRSRFIDRCRDNALEGRGFIVALVDDEISFMLSLVKRNQREAIDPYLERRFDEVVR